MSVMSPTSAIRDPRSAFQQSAHPVFPMAVPVSRQPDGRVLCQVRDKQQIFTLDQLTEFVLAREKAIRLEVEDPFRYGVVLDAWKMADAQFDEVRELLILGGNRSSKTEYASHKAVQVLTGADARRVWCLHTSAPNSIAMQQPYIYKYLPREWKAVGKKGQVTNISYTQKNGFSENTFVCPNGSQCWFLNYMQDDDVIEGGELDFIWCDELVPLDWLATLRYRLVTRRGRLLTTFTPIDGYTPTVKEYLTNARTILDMEAELLPLRNGAGEEVGKERVPLIQEARNTPKPARIVYFPTKGNPYGGYEAMAEELARATREEILCRAYGVPVKRIAGRFPKFSEKVHVIPADRVPKEGTNYLIVDPCGGRNWFMTWVRVDVRGRMFVYREWPCPSVYVEGVGYPGAWAVPGKKMDGDRGPAQKPFGFGFVRYKEEIERLEAGEKVEERIMDSRYGNSSTVGKELVTTVIEECEEIGLSFIPAPGEHIEEGVDMINNMLHYDETQPVSATNEPTLYVVDVCENTIYALAEWTGADGKHGACKDPVDNLRYAALSDLQCLEGDVMRARGGGYY